MTERSFVFGVDLDGVVADFYGGLRPIAAEWLGVDLRHAAGARVVGARASGASTRRRAATKRCTSSRSCSASCS